MTSINPINVNAQGIGNSYGYGFTKSDNKDAKTEENTTQTAGSQQNAVAADDVLNYMAQSAQVNVKGTSASSISNIDTSKYVDSESAQRIAGFVSQFEDIVATNLTAISQEFPNMSDSSKQALALAQVNG